MRTIRTILLSMPILLASSLAAGNACAADPARMSGDKERDRQILKTFDHWLVAYSGGDLAGTMSIFDRDLVFSFQGSKDQGYDEMQASYDQDFHSRKGSVEWVPAIEEVYANGHMAIVRSIWELKVITGGKTESRARNRSMDVLHLDGDGKWHIFRSINYPEKAG